MIDVQQKNGFFKRWILKWLGFQPAYDRQIKIRESLTHEDYVLMNRVWYRGDPAELSQFYKALGTFYGNDSRFWTISPVQGPTIRKIHSGLPSLIIDMLNDITNDDCLGITLENEEQQTVWDEILKENKFDKLQKDGTKDMLTEGDCAFKISIDTSLSKLPIIEVVSGELVEYTYQRGRLKEILFTTFYVHDEKQYRLIETYGRGYVRSKLYDDNDKEVELSTVPDLIGIEEEVLFQGDFIMAVPMMISKSPKYENRGKALLETKYDLFDSLDEVVSQWLDAIRLGRANKFIPEDMIPRDTEGNKLPLNPITNTFYTYTRPRTVNANEAPKPEHTQPDIAADNFLASYIQYLDMCLMGIISPSTLGIDVKKLDNGEAQREKEKATMYTRNKIITALEDIIPKVVEAAMKTYDIMNGKTVPGEYNPSVEFGEYANPSFEAVIETIGKAVTNKVMSYEEAVEQIYGDTKTDEEKSLEVERIKEQNSFSTGEGGFGGMDNFFEDDNEQNNENDPEEEKKKPDDEKEEANKE